MNAIEQQIKDLNQRYFPQIKRILNKNSYMFSELLEATPQQDYKEGFDSIFTFNDIKIPLRIRKYEYAKEYRDVTIRSRTRSNGETEIDKIKQGFGDYYFYAWECEDRKRLFCYLIFDLKKFNSSGLVLRPSDPDIPNGDGTSFNAYRIFDLIMANALLIYEGLQ